MEQNHLLFCSSLSQEHFYTGSFRFPEDPMVDPLGDALGDPSDLQETYQRISLGQPRGSKGNLSEVNIV